MFKVAALILLVGLLVLLVMSLLIMTNLNDQVAALRTEVEARRRGPPPPPSAQAPFDVETSPFATAEGGTPPQLVALGGPPARFAVVALVEVVGPEGARTPLASNPVVLVPGVTAEIPVGPGTGCLIPAGAPAGAWVVSLEGNAVRVAPRGCFYARPTRGRLRGLVSH